MKTPKLPTFLAILISSLPILAADLEKPNVSELEKKMTELSPYGAARTPGNLFVLPTQDDASREKHWKAFLASALEEDCKINFQYSWQNGQLCLSMLNACYIYSDGKEPLQALQSSQPDNGDVQQKYRIFEGEVGVEHLMEVVTTVHGGSANFMEADVNIVWQRDNNAVSLEKAMINWNKYVQGDRKDSKLKCGAIFFLMNGQRHNPAVMNLYRACFAEDADRLFQIVRHYIGDPKS